MLKDLFESDLNIFFDLDEHAETHTIDEKTMTIIVDNEQLMKRSKQEFEGVIVGDLLYYAKVSDFLKKPRPDEIQIYDGDQYQVIDCREVDGMYEIILKGAFV